MMSNMAGMVMQGMAFGGGSAVAHRAIDSVVGPREMTVNHEGQETAAGGNSEFAGASTSGACSSESMQFNQCVQENPDSLASCKFYFDVLNQCQTSSSSPQW